MGAVKLYKYLDFNGGLMMLYHSNLQFTNATQLNDPFDCHPSLIDFSNVPKEACGGWTPEIIEELRRDPFRRTREEVWICSLSKIHDSILMWSYYSKHKGICVGLDMEKAQKYLSRIYGKIMISCSVVEVQYKDIVEKPDYFRDAKDFFHYQLSTKAKACIIRKSKFPQNPKRSVRFSGKRTKRSVQKRKARNTQKAETKVL
jgi:hypothetical protein